MTSLADRAAWGGVVTGPAFVLGLAVGLSRAGAPFPRPGADVGDVQRFFQGEAGPERINIAGQGLSALALASFTASATRLARRAGPGVALPATALAGGALATTSLLASAGAAARLTGRAGQDPVKAVSLHRFLFRAGGPVHGVGLALLLTAVGVAGRRTDALPRPLTAAALASGAVDGLAPMALIAPKTALVIPAGRFPTFVVLALAGLRLARTPPSRPS